VPNLIVLYCYSKVETIGGSVKKLLVLLLLSVFSLVPSLPAEAAKDKSIKLPGVATITYPAVVKLAKSGCQTIPFKYQAKGVSKIAGLMTVSLTDADGYTVGGGLFVRGKAMTDLYPNYRSLKDKGTYRLQVCREPWVDPDLNVEISDAWPSTVEIEFSASPKGDYDITPRAIGTIKFTGKFVGNVLDDLFP
jgi:hypothetical protein